ncbi:MAG TPA: asparagine--tRNA ligase [Bacilli bacterium]|nr:asparagine--tRNA ligase [Bacilli bacterium]
MAQPEVIRYIYEMLVNGEEQDKQELVTEIELNGWVRTNRNNGSIGFMEINDGTYFKNAQIVYDKGEGFDFDTFSKINTGAAVQVIGNLVLTPDNKQPFEMHLKSFAVLGEVADDYPLQKKRHSFEFLRDIAHLRPRSNTFGAVFRLRSVLSMAIHTFFQSQGFVYVHTPIITGNDAEGAGETFKVASGKNNSFTEFFGKPVSLTVSGQLHVEAFAMAYRDVYTFGPTFRAEISNTVRHASEFWMIEPEIAFADLDDDMNLIEECIKYCISYVLDECDAEMEFFNQFIDKNLLERLHHVLSSDFKRMPYTEAISLLQEAVKNGHKFDNPNIYWGMDLQSEHERYITDSVVQGPVFLIDYPSEIKAFYMRQNDDGKTVAACDLLVPGVGELVGGSQREERYEILKAKMEELGNLKDLEWYLDLRKYGGCKHAGFGIGFDRLIMYLTGIQNIRDVQPFPRTPGSIRY